ncbi:hypothetical protein MJG53_018436 [Ovis ammon polii x Ovis aries]|uniref:Uncharacterized protein n=1 Tax=Ovis ammon polii x Ovis aries TaxID=2918886 RepID=A0ACB9U749_9CETA|nr:hypothetical protein MJG53_018436 [Ovis ammon polii x Ovis aries]
MHSVRGLQEMPPVGDDDTETPDSSHRPQKETAQLRNKTIIVATERPPSLKTLVAHPPLLAKVFRLSQYCVDLASPTSSSSLGTRDLVPPEEVPCSETIVTFDIDEMYAFSECDSKHVTFVTRQF